jgi:hypothetical protein
MPQFSFWHAMLDYVTAGLDYVMAEPDYVMAEPDYVMAGPRAGHLFPPKTAVKPRKLTLVRA